MLTLKPVYIICADSVVEDKLTNRASIFNVIEKISFSKKPRADDEPKVVKTLRIVVTALWVADGADRDEDIEMEFALVLPKSQKFHSLLKQSFRVLKGHRLCRFNLVFDSPPPLDGAGVLEFQHRVKASPTSEWQTQSFPVFIEEIGVSDSVESKSGSLR